MDVRLNDVENAIVEAFPSLLQKDPYNFKQFKEYADTIQFTIKVKGKLVNFAVKAVEKRLVLYWPGNSKECKKPKEIVKIIEKM